MKSHLFFFFGSIDHEDTIFLFGRLAYFTLKKVSGCIYFAAKDRASCFSWPTRFPYRTYSTFFYTVICWWASMFNPYPSYCELSCSTHEWTRISSRLTSLYLGKFPGVRWLGHILDPLSNFQGITKVSPLAVVLIYINTNSWKEHIQFKTGI